jgi:hypothetical protein
VVVTIAYGAHVIAMFLIKLFLKDEPRTAFGTAVASLQSLPYVFSAKYGSIFLIESGSLS